MRACYRCLLWLHPPAFRREFGGEMLWIFDEARERGTFPLLADGMGSLARQWVLRSGWWKIAVALALAVFQVVLGGFGLMLFRRQNLGGASIDSELTHSGAIGHEPLNIATLMYLGVMVTGGLIVMVIGLTSWHRGFAARRRPVLHRVR